MLAAMDSGNRLSTRAGILLCGGRSLRMGHSKAWLSFDAIPQVTRLANLLVTVCSTVLVSAAEDQNLPPLPREACVVADRDCSEGPLAGITTCHDRIPRECESGFVAACDIPFLTAPVIERFLDLLESGSSDAVIARHQDRLHPLCAAYRRSALATAADLFGKGRRRVLDWIDILELTTVTPAEFDDIAGTRPFLVNVNTPEDFERALAEYGRGDIPA